MNEHLEGEDKGKNTSKGSGDDSMLDFKSPIYSSTEKLSKLTSTNTHQKKRTAGKFKNTGKNSKETKTKLPGKRKHFQELQPSIESSFFKSKDVCNNDSTIDGKVALVCPLCFKTFRDLNSRVVHMKICAYKNNIATKKLLDVLELQKRQENERKSLGLLAAPIMQDKKRTSLPKANLHEECDLELALALSKSLQEAEESDIINENEISSKMPNEAAPHLNEPIGDGRLEKFGFANSKPPSLIKHKKRRNNELTLLQTRSQEERNHILTERISEILIGEGQFTQKQKEEGDCSRITKEKVILKSTLLQDICNKEEKLWNQAKLTDNKKCFYVTNLSEFITPEVIKKEETILEFTNTCNMRDTKLIKRMTGVCNDEEGYKTVSTKSPFIDENCKNCCNRQFVHTVIENWINAINDSSASDLIIFVNNGKHIWAHKLVLYVQCSNILLDVTPNDTLQFSNIKEKICWMDISYDIALAFLEFIYSGIIKKYLYVLEDLTSFSCLRNLARKYKVTKLFLFLEKEEIEVKQENVKIHCTNDKIISEGENHPALSNNVENFICVSKDCTLNECEKFIVEDSQETSEDKSEFTKIDLIKDTPSCLSLQKEVKYLNNDANVIENFSASPDLFDDINDTRKSEKEDNDFTLPEVTHETPSSSKANCPILLNYAEKNLKSSPQFSTPKRAKHSQIVKPKSNLSLFIEAFQKENESSDIDVESQCLILPVSPKMRRNPFYTKQHDASSDNFTSNANAIVREKVKQKRNILSMFDDITNSDLDTKTDVRSNLELVDNVESLEFNVEECIKTEENNSVIKSIDNSGKEFQNIALDNTSASSLSTTVGNVQNCQTFLTTQCDESISDTSLNSDADENEISMYSKYKRSHENNSILKYRNCMQEHILKSQVNSSVAYEECIERNSTTKDTVSLVNINERPQFQTNLVREHDDPIYNIYDINEHHVPTFTTTVSLSPESDCEVSNVHECQNSKIETDILCTEIIKKSGHVFENDIYLASAHTDNDADSDDSVLIKVNESKKDVISTVLTKKHSAPTIINNSSVQLEDSEKNLPEKQSVRKFQRKSISETSLHVNGRRNENIVPKFQKNINKTLYKCSHTNVPEINASPEIIRDSVTPPPNYSGMLTPELHAELNKYGLKMQKRKRAIKLLTYIYNELHPTIHTTQTDIESESAIISSEDDEPPEKKINYKTDYVDYICSQESQLPLSQKCIVGAQLPENINNEQRIVDELEPSCTKDNTPNIRNMFLKLLTINKELYNKVLTYEPLCINSLHSMLKAEGFKCKINALMDFLDEECITFYLQERSRQK